MYFQNCTKLRGTSKKAQNPTKNFLRCTLSHEELPKMLKIQRVTSKNAQNPRRNFQICTKSHKELSKNSMKNFKNIL
jgi:hypothetical protein